MNAKRIYIADDEVNICNILKDFLTKEGYKVTSFYDGSSILEAFRKDVPDMIITDIMMPGLDGYLVCSTIREESNIPVIILSAKDTEHDKIAGLSLGSDDYLTKPFSPMELIARVKSIFRRIEMDRSDNSAPKIIKIQNLTINPNTRLARVNDKDIGLTGTEFSLVHYLATNINRAISRNELLERVWGFQTEVETRATDDMVKRIRKKLSAADSNVKIQTVWGFGFKIENKE